jgi:hypothetical protein
MVYMVNEEVAGCVDNHAVHFGMDSLSIFECCADGIAGVSADVSVPFILVQLLEIFGINDGVFAAGQGYPAEGAAVANPAV